MATPGRLERRRVEEVELLNKKVDFLQQQIRVLLEKTEKVYGAINILAETSNTVSKRGRPPKGDD